MENVRFPLLKKDYFLENVIQDATMQEEGKCKDLLLETSSYHLAPVLVKPSKRTTPRPSYEDTKKPPAYLTGHSIHAIGGYNGMSLLCYSQRNVGTTIFYQLHFSSN